MKKWLRGAGILIGVVATAYFAIFAYRTLTTHELRGFLTLPMTGAVALAAVAYASIIPTTSWAWRRLLSGVGVPSNIWLLNMILGVTQLAKYVPGNVGQYFGRSAMALQRGIPGRPLFATLALELALAAMASIFVGFVALITCGSGLAISIPQYGATVKWGGFGLIALFGVALAILYVQPGISRRLLGDGPLPPMRVLLYAFSAYALNYIIIGVALFVLAFAVFAPPAGTFPFYIAVFSLSWIAGFVIPGAPAGLGVREGVMAVLLAPMASDANALQIIIGFRLATTFGDLLAFAWGGSIYLGERRRLANGSDT